MNRLLGSIIAGIAVVIAASAMFVFTHRAEAQSVNDFVISSFDIKYELGRDESNRSTLKTTETIVADFQKRDQNHGIERAIPTSYDGHPTKLKIDSVTDSNGSPLEYSTRSDNGNSVLRIGDPDAYVFGAQIYKITYTQQDVTRYYDNTGSDEWYWDTNGTEWRVPIERLTVSVRLDGSVANAIKEVPFCYQGAARSTDRCTITEVSSFEYAAESTELRRGENMTFAFGFEKGTFAPYEPSFMEIIGSLWRISSFVTLFVAIILLFIFIGVYARRRNRSGELHTIVVQYIPPKNTSVIVSSQVVTARGSVFGAQLIDFAVRHIISIIETKPKSFWSAAEYDIEVLVAPATLLEEEREILTDMFATTPKVGDRIALKKLRSDYSYARRTADNDAKLKKLIEGPYALREKSKPASRFFYRWATALVIIGVLTLSIPMAVLAGIIALFGVTIRPLSDKGLEVRRYLLGLDRYIKAAETERIKMLQGPDTAEKVGEAVNTDNPGQIVKLYERVLPYAILFGHEKQWTKRLGEFYQTSQTSPDWYTGTTAFNAALFASSVSSFSSAAGYSGGTSSSSGGSSGGGSSGGGGGGGGGGGW